jgi:hypothetical protein
MQRIAVLGAALLLAACNAGARSDATPTAGPGRPPQQVAADLFVCPGGYGWAAYGHLVYAPNDSSKPTADVRPDRCFSSLDEANQAGFHLKPPPPGGVVIDAIYLVPPDPPILPVCREAARRLGFTVLCPGLVPGDANSFVDCAIIGCVGYGALDLYFTFSGPPGYVGIPGQDGNHLFVLEARAGRERTLEFLGCEGRQDVEPAAFRGHAAQLIHCLDGETLNAGHVMLVWVEDGIRYVVSLHSDTPVNRDLALAMAEHLVPVSP